MKLDLVVTPVAANKWCPYSSEHCFVLMVLVYGHKSRLKLQDCPNTGQFNFTNSLMKLCFMPFLADPKCFQAGNRQANHILLSSFSVEQGRKVAMENILLVQKKEHNWKSHLNFLFSHFLTLLSIFSICILSIREWHNDQWVFTVSLLGLFLFSIAGESIPEPFHL